MGMAIPTREVATRGRRQYPRVEAERAKVRVEVCGEEEEEAEEEYAGG